MPPKWLRAFQGFLGGFLDNQLQRYSNSPESSGDPSAVALTSEDVLANFLRGAEPLPFMNTISPEPEVENFPIQLAASFIVPGLKIPGGPIFRKAAEFLEGLKKVPTDELLRFKNNVSTSMFDEMGRINPNFNARTRSGSTLENRTLIEMDVLNDAADIEIINRAKAGDMFAMDRMTSEISYDLGETGIRGIGPDGILKYMDEWEQGARSRIKVNESFLDFLDGASSGFVSSSKKPDSVLGDFLSSSEFDNQVLHQVLGTFGQATRSTFQSLSQIREQSRAAAEGR